MKKIKKYIITLCLILSTLFINITGVYCLTIDTTYRDSGVFDYNLFNFSLKPFFVDLDTGEGIYYAGYCPEFQFNSINNNNAISQNYLEQQLQTDDGIYIAFNSMKTQLYYFDGEKYTIYPNGGLFTGNNKIKIQLFLSKMGIPSLTQDTQNILLYNYMQDNNIIFDNYVITRDTTAYRSSDKISYGIPYLTIESINNYPVALPELQAYIYAYNSSYNNHNMTNDYYVANYRVFVSDSNTDGKYNHKDSIVIDMYNLTDLELETLFCFDFCNIKTNVYDRVYYTLSELIDIFGDSIYDEISFNLDINSIKTLSNLYVAGQQENIYIYGIGVCFVESGLDNYFDFLNNQDIIYSNSIYSSFQYDTNISTSVPTTYKSFKLTNNYSSFDLKDEGFMKNEEGNSLVELIIGDDGDTGRRPSSGSSNNRPDFSGEIDFTGDISNIITSTVKMFNKLYSFTGDIANMSAKLFSFLPNELLTLIYLAIQFCLLVGIIKIVKGIL